MRGSGYCPSVESRLATRVSTAVAGLSPGYFALVMGTGIISVGMDLNGHRWVSRVLLVICAVAFVVLFALTLMRIIGFWERLADDFTNPSRGFGFFTFVAGTNVLGTRLLMGGHHFWTAVLLGASSAGWLVLGYVVPWTAVLGRSARPVVATANGTWFIWVVSSQSVAVAAASLQPFTHAWRPGLAVLAVVAWSVGVALYAAAGIFVSLRLLLYELQPEDLTAPYWVAMGAASITVLAGARIVEMAGAPMVDATRGLIAGSSVVLWAFATWLGPVLAAAGWWRHVANRVPLVYDATLWSLVFPLGMYAVAGIYLGQADHLPLVGSIGSGELWAALTVCGLTMIAMVVHLVRTVALPGGPAASGEPAFRQAWPGRQGSPKKRSAEPARRKQGSPKQE